MNKFVRNVFKISVIACLIIAILNFVFIKYIENDTEGVDKFRSIPSDIQICNFGSSHGLRGYNYADVSKTYECFNFGLTAQTLSYDWRLFQNYKDKIAPGAVVFITVSYFPLFGESETNDIDFQSKNKRYYKILPPDLIKQYDFKTDLFVHYIPILGNDMTTLVIDTKNTLNSKDQKKENLENKEWRRQAVECDVNADALAAYKRHIVKNKRDKKGKRIRNNEEIESLYNLIYGCYEIDATPVLVTTPYLKEYTDMVQKDTSFYKEFYSILNEVVSKTGVKYYDYAFDQRFQNNYSYFINSDHLNEAGARKFVNILMDEVVARGHLLENN